MFFKIEPNNITVNSILNLVTKKLNSSVLIIGTGNIAFSTCLRLKLINWRFKWYSEENRESKSKEMMKDNFGGMYL